MNRRTILFALLGSAATPLLPLPAAYAAAISGAAGAVFTADELGASISRFDLATGEVQTLKVPIAPHNVQVGRDGRRLFAVGDVSAGETHAHKAGDHSTVVPGRLMVFDAAAFTRGPTQSIQVDGHPAHVVDSRDGRLVFVTLAEANAVAVVDLAAGKVTRRIKTGRYPHGLRLDPAGQTIAVANVEDGSVSLIEAAYGREQARIAVGKTPVQVGYTPDGRQLYVSLRDENRIAVVDMSSRSVSGTISVGRNPIQLHATPDGRFVYVANQGTTEDPADTVSVVDVASGSVVDTIRTGAGAHGVAVSQDGRWVFVSNIADNSISVIEVARRAVVATIPVGKGPNGISFVKATT